MRPTEALLALNRKLEHFSPAPVYSFGRPRQNPNGEYSSIEPKCMVGRHIARIYRWPDGAGTSVVAKDVFSDPVISDHDALETEAIFSAFLSRVEQSPSAPISNYAAWLHEILMRYQHASGTYSPVNAPSTQVAA